MATIPAIPEVTGVENPSARIFLNTVKEILEIWLGRRGTNRSGDRVLSHDEILKLLERGSNDYEPFSLPEGSGSGDIIRWNADTKTWETSAQPFEFDQIVLNPSGAALSDKEGSLIYKQDEKVVYVCTNDT